MGETILSKSIVNTAVAAEVTQINVSPSVMTTAFHTDLNMHLSISVKT